MRHPLFYIDPFYARRRKDARLRRPSGNIGHDKHFARRQTLGLGKLPAPSIGHHITSARATLERDPVRIGVQQQWTGLTRQFGCRGFIADRIEQPRCQLVRGQRPFAPVGKKASQPFIEIDVVSAEPLFRQHDGEHRRLFPRTLACRRNHHGCQPRRQRKAAHQTTALRQCAAFVERAQIFEKRHRFFKCGFGGHIKKSKRRRVLNPPMGEIKRKAGEIARQNLRWRKGIERRRLSLMPQADRNTGFRSPGAPRPLVGGSARHPHRLEPRDSRCRFEDGQSL
ncbi:hypothetical protein D3C86_1290860 [compost metagenome]